MLKSNYTDSERSSSQGILSYLKILNKALFCVVFSLQITFTFFLVYTLRYCAVKYDFYLIFSCHLFRITEKKIFSIYTFFSVTVYKGLTIIEILLIIVKVFMDVIELIFGIFGQQLQFFVIVNCQELGFIIYAYQI